MLNLLKPISKSKQNGMSITSCYAHCQAQYQVMWHADNSTLIGTKVSLIRYIKLLCSLNTRIHTN